MQPWVTVLQKWKNTAAYRVAAVQARSKKLADFKLYADPKADNLVFVFFKYTKILLVEYIWPAYSQGAESCI